MIPSEPLDPDEDADEVVVAGGSAEVDVCKKVMTPKGRAVEDTPRPRRSDRQVPDPGHEPRHRRRPQRARLRHRPARDDVPARHGKGHHRNGSPCVTIPLLSGQREAFVWMRVNRTASGELTNVAAVTSRDGGTRRNPATVIVEPAQAAGGVTG